MFAIASSSRLTLGRLAILGPARTRLYVAATKPPSQEASPSASSESPSPAKAALPPSSCPAGTPMPGLSILKDRPEVVALPDDQYPPWLWELLDDPSMKTTYASVESSGDPIVSAAAGDAPTAAETKGQLRIKQKREMKELRAKMAAQKLAAQKAEAAKSKAKGTTPMPGAAEMSEAEAQAALLAAEQARTPEEQEEQERSQRRQLRKANRESIKTRNFVGR